jgi:hypothetical protein
MRHRLPGLWVGLAASLRSMPTALCRILKSSSAEWTLEEVLNVIYMARINFWKIGVRAKDLSPIQR